jgi:endonuclease/exonuclease/phosphatase family metal-dependent hydrolase
MRLTACALLSLILAVDVVPAQAPVRVLTFNIRYGTANDGAHRWPLRSSHVFATIRDHAPHILGIQEALRGQLDEIARAVPGYRELGVGRDDGRTAGEYAALLIDTTRFAIIADGHFWYSDTPEVPGSRHWGNNVTRICTWARLVDRASGDTVRVYNSHWDHESQPSREKSAALLLSHIAKDGGPRDRLLVLADFNSDEENPAFHMLLEDPRANLHDTFRELHPDAFNVGTYHAFKGDSSGGKIDAILAGSGWVTVDAAIDRRKFGDLWPSDHFPVSALLRPTMVVSALASFEPVADERFPAGVSGVKAFADFDADGDWDALVAGPGGAGRLFERRGADFPEMRRHKLPATPIIAAAWGNFTRPEFPPLDRFSDLAIAPAAGGIRLYHNRGGDPRVPPELRWSGLEDITAASGINATAGKVRTLKWLDFDGDFDVDLFIGYSDRAPKLYAAQTVSGIAGSVRFDSVQIGDFAHGIAAAVWVDHDMDGDLDVIVGGARGMPNHVIQRWSRGYTDATRNTPVEWAGRAEKVVEEMNSAICVGDVDSDGMLDLFFANHGRNALLLSRGAGLYDDVTAAWGLAERGSYESCAFGDFENDGRIDLFLAGAPGKGTEPQAFLLRNTGTHFLDVTPPELAARRGVTSGVLIDFDRDGDLDLALSGTAESLFENKLDTAASRRSLAVRVRDIQDYMTLTGAEVRVFDAKTGKLVATRIVDDGGDVSVQHDVPLHFGLPEVDEVDVEVTYPRGDRRLLLRVESIALGAYQGRVLTLRLPPEVRR